MIVLKRILIYLIWTIIAFLCAIGYVLIILGDKPVYKGSFQILIDMFYLYGFIYLGSIIGSIIALSYILVDVFYLNKKLKNKANAISIRLLIIIAITSVTGLVHYTLEKVIDVI